MVEYSARLDAAMKDANVTVTVLAKHLRLSYQAVKKVLTGGSSAFNAANNDAAAHFLGVSPTWLATGRQPMRPGDGLVIASEPVLAGHDESTDPRAVSLLQRFCALANEEHKAVVYAQSSALLDAFEALQRQEQQPHKPARAAAPAMRAGKPHADPAR